MSTSRPYISDTIRQQVAETAQYRCGYCLTSQRFTAKILHVEHIIPLAAGGSSTPENLWLACDLCNKGVQTAGTDPLTQQTVALYNPRTQNWFDHFAWSMDGIHVIGLTPTGRVMVVALRLNNAFLVEARSWWVTAGWHPPKE